MTAQAALLRLIDAAGRLDKASSLDQQALAVQAVVNAYRDYVAAATSDIAGLGL